MNTRIIKGFFSLLISIAILISGFMSYFINAHAEVIISDGDYSYVFNEDSWKLYSYNGKDTEITLPSSFANYPVKSIYKRCFENSTVTSVTIPNGYIYIGEYAFIGTSNLNRIIIPNTIKEIGTGAFSGCGLTNLDLSSNNIKEISSFMCKNCASLKSVLLPDSVEKIGESAFRESGIKSIVIPKKVTQLNAFTFQSTKSLENVELPPNLVSIGSNCFENSSVSKIELPETLETIGESAFRNANSLSELYIPNSVYSIGAYALYPMSVQSKIHVLCFKNSYADEYCYENFVQNTTTYNYIIGDANLDGKRNISDATAVQKYKAGILTVNNPCAKLLMDTNFDGNISIRDATLIQMRIADIITEFIH